MNSCELLIPGRHFTGNIQGLATVNWSHGNYGFTTPGFEQITRRFFQGSQNRTDFAGFLTINC
jgi:hypothetical protein